MEKFVFLEDIDPVSVGVRDELVLFFTEKGSLRMDISLPAENEETVERLLFRNVLYIFETAISRLFCRQVRNMGIPTNFSGESAFNRLEWRERTTQA